MVIFRNATPLHHPRLALADARGHPTTGHPPSGGGNGLTMICDSGKSLAACARIGLRPRFSVRTMFIVLAVLGAAMAWVSYKSQHGWTVGKIERLIEREFNSKWSPVETSGWLVSHGIKDGPIMIGGPGV